MSERRMLAAETDLLLSDMLSRGISVEWFEGAALVNEVIERLAESPSPSNVVPDLHEIALTADGRVVLRSTGRADEPVRRLGQLLQALLNRSELPVQLRLVISKATSLPVGYASAGEFGGALAYFERPQRSTVLRVLYDRAICASASISPSEAPTLDHIAPLPSDKSSDGVKHRLDWRWIRVPAVIAAVVVASAAGVHYLRIWGPAHDVRSRLSAVAGHASVTAADTIIAGVSAVTDSMGLGRLVPAEAAAIDSEPAPTPASPSSVPHAAKKAGVRSKPIAAYDLEPRELPDGPIPAVFPSFIATNDPPEAAPAADSIDPVVYSAGAEGVAPPVAIQPYLPRELPSAIRQGDLSRIELVVAVDGSVASVKLLGRVPNVRDVMFLSVAKAWQFRPALKNGTPVKYRKTIWIADQ